MTSRTTHCTRLKCKTGIQALIVCLLLFPSCQSSTLPPDLQSNEVIPSHTQLTYQQMELIGFIHFSINTFTDREWGYGDEDPALFNPTSLNVEQWVTTAKNAGMGQLILTAKHHDGFCLWPSKYNTHNISRSPYHNSEGDIVREFVDACRKHGLKAGLYLSPWDRNHKDYGRPEYLTYYRSQLTELLTEYGEISEIWFDGANGGDGYYGGANETRRIDRRSYYEWDSTFALVKRLQPDILIFSDAGPDIHWIGNEHGAAGETFWSTFSRDSVFIGTPKMTYLNTGDPQGKDWVVGQCDVSIRPGWFYHPAEDSLVKTPQELVDIYYKSVGRNAILLLNLPPDRRGLIHEADVRSLETFRQILDETFSADLTGDATATAHHHRLRNDKFAPSNVLDEDPATYWAADDGVPSSTITIELKQHEEFDRILLQEPIHLGQRVSRFSIEIETDRGWETIFHGTTIGYKRLLRIDPVITKRIRLHVLASNNTIAISNIGLYRSSARELTQ